MIATIFTVCQIYERSCEYHGRVKFTQYDLHIKIYELKYRY